MRQRSIALYAAQDHNEFTTSSPEFMENPALVWQVLVMVDHKFCTIVVVVMFDGQAELRINKTDKFGTVLCPQLLGVARFERH